MSDVVPVIYLVRHGATAWSISRRHTGRTDIPLNEEGERQSRELRGRLRDLSFARVFTSPSQRARRTCELAGFGSAAEIDPDLAEWDYGDYEGLRTVEIHKDRPDWELFRDGCPGGENVKAVGARADRIVDRLRAIDGNVLGFSSGHLLRVLATRWLGLDPSNGRLFLLSPAAISILGYEHSRADPVIRLWNDEPHYRKRN